MASANRADHGGRNLSASAGVDPGGCGDHSEVLLATDVAPAGEKYGLELVAGSGGLLRRNAIYILLGRMEDKGLIEGREEATPPGESGPPRRVYRVSGNGARVLAVHEMRTGALPKDAL